MGTSMCLIALSDMAAAYLVGHHPPARDTFFNMDDQEALPRPPVGGSLFSRRCRTLSRLRRVVIQRPFGEGRS